MPRRQILVLAGPEGHSLGVCEHGGALVIQDVTSGSLIGDLPERSGAFLVEIAGQRFLFFAGRAVDARAHHVVVKQRTDCDIARVLGGVWMTFPRAFEPGPGAHVTWYDETDAAVHEAELGQLTLARLAPEPPGRDDEPPGGPGWTAYAPR